MASLKEFKVNPQWWRLNIWGGGHTAETDPTRKGWWAYHGEGSAPDVVLVGRKGVVGCFSARPTMMKSAEGNPRLDVAFYDETPESVVEGWKTYRYVDASFKMLDDIPGWGLEAIEVVGKI